MRIIFGNNLTHPTERFVIARISSGEYIEAVRIVKEFSKSFPLVGLFVFPEYSSTGAIELFKCTSIHKIFPNGAFDSDSALIRFIEKNNPPYDDSADEIISDDAFPLPPTITTMSTPKYPRIFRQSAKISKIMITASPDRDALLKHCIEDCKRRL